MVEEDGNGSDTLKGTVETPGDLLKPALYRREGSTAAPARPALLGGKCVCGYVFFPMQHYGCERCGSTELSPLALTGRGRLLASARVHLDTGKHRKAPFTVGSIKLEDGPIVRTILLDNTKPFHADDPVATVLVDVLDPEGVIKRDLRFQRDA
ncbi:MAG TPA: zinc ribbon domain-containing protein [Rhizomicrobium sp.]|nr:zinc ribbon domain-containing protein [Rhizomicrobium sp.]